MTKPASFVFVVGLVCCDQAVAASRRQSACNASVSGVTLSVDLPQPVAAGSLVVIGAGYDATSGTLQLASVADSSGDRFVAATAPHTGSTHTLHVFTTRATGGATSVTVTMNRPLDTTLTLFFAEYQGVDTVIDSLPASGTDDQAVVGPTATDEILFATVIAERGRARAGVMLAAGFEMFQECSGDFEIDQLSGPLGAASSVVPLTTTTWVVTSLLLAQRADAGTADAGIADAGTDGGLTFDAGLAQDDAGSLPDSGLVELRPKPWSLRVGCDAPSLTVALVAFTVLLAAAGRRARAARSEGKKYDEPPGGLWRCSQQDSP